MILDLTSIIRLSFHCSTCWQAHIFPQSHLEIDSSMQILSDGQEDVALCLLNMDIKSSISSQWYSSQDIVSGLGSISLKKKCRPYLVKPVLWHTCFLQMLGHLHTLTSLFVTTTFCCQDNNCKQWFVHPQSASCPLNLKASHSSVQKVNLFLVKISRWVSMVSGWNPGYRLSPKLSTQYHWILGTSCATVTSLVARISLTCNHGPLK